MAGLKSLAKETAIYGLSSIVGRFLNYLLVPIYASAMSAASGGYGVVTEVYAWTALLLVILTYGMETTFFRFVNKEEENPKRVYSTVLLMVGSTSLIFVALCLAFLPQIAGAMGYAEHPWYVGFMAIVVAMDAFQSIPFAYLRYQKRAIKFASLKLLFIILNITLNLIYYVVMGGSDVMYAFLFNLVCTSTVMVLMLPLLKFGGGFDRALAKRMLKYSYPILILGIAGILNQVADKIIFRHVYKGSDASVQLGIYGAASKIAMIMAMLTQAFRYAYEPFVFGKSKDKDSKEMYAKAMKYFIIFTLLAFLAVEFYIDIYLSFWYKLIDQTRWGAYFSFAGCAVLIAVNVIFVPVYGYMACAWAGFAGYGVAMLLSYFVGQKKFPIAYDLKSIAFYVVAAVALFAVDRYLALQGWAGFVLGTVMLAVFVALIVKKEGIDLKSMLRRR